MSTDKKESIYSKEAIDVADKGAAMVKSGIFGNDILPNTGKIFNPKKALNNIKILSQSEKYLQILNKASK